MDRWRPAGGEAAEDQVSRAEDLRRRLCHDLRGHLATVRLLADAARHDPHLPPQVADHLDSLLDEVDAARSLVLQTLSRRSHADVVDVAVVVAEAARSPRWEGGARLVVRSSSATVRVDPVELRRVVDNLLENAMRAAGSRGVVRVRTRRRHEGGPTGSGEVLIVVDDSGPGFAQDRPSRPGGLGLRIVRDLVAGMGGRLVLGTSWQGGAHVEVALPAA